MKYIVYLSTRSHYGIDTHRPLGKYQTHKEAEEAALAARTRHHKLKYYKQVYIVEVYDDDAEAS